MKDFFLFFLLLFGWHLADAQDPRFAQFYAAPDQLNPALNVVYEGQFRFIANYRDQWSSVLNDVPFRTFAAHLDYRFNVGREDYMAVGINALQDEAGVAHFKQVNGNVNAAYMKYLGGTKKRDYFLVAGAQIGVRQHGIEFGDLWFSEQYDAKNESIDFTLPTGEINNQNSQVVPDFSAGILWYMIAGEHSLYFGGAMYHLNSPNVAVFEGSRDPLYRRYVGHAGGEWAVNKYLSLLPAAAVFIQGPSTDINIGTNLRFTSGDQNDLALRIGGWAHLSGKEPQGLAFEAFTVTSMLEMRTWTLGLSYDINTSQLTPATNSRGAFEASFIYIIPEKGRRVKVRCPKF